MRYGFKKSLNSLSLVDKDCIDLPEKPETLQYSINPLMCFVSIGKPPLVLGFGYFLVSLCFYNIFSNLKSQIALTARFVG